MRRNPASVKKGLHNFARTDVAKTRRIFWRVLRDDSDEARGLEILRLGIPTVTFEIADAMPAAKGEWCAVAWGPAVHTPHPTNSLPATADTCR